VEAFITLIIPDEQTLSTAYPFTVMPNMQSFNMPNVRDTFDSTLRFQEQVVTNSLEFQAMVARLSIEGQKQFWESYFNMLRKS
jgi:hypothetical protein